MDLKNKLLPLGSFPRKHYIPLESNPTVFTALIHALGVSEALEFQDVLSLDEPDLLAMVSRPALALVLVFPAADAYDALIEEEKKAKLIYTGSGESEPVMWFKQTINNACGLYAALHATCNGPSRQFIKPNLALSNFLETCIPLAPSQRALALEVSEEVERVHDRVGKTGDTAPPANAEDDVDYHYVCFVPSHLNNHIYEMDGMKQGPLDTGIALADGEDVLCDAGRGLIRKFIEREDSLDIGFSLLALVATEDK